jgi:HlyD family secretion protein
MSIVTARDWIPLLAIGLLMAAGIIWSILGHVPATVGGRGVLVQPRRVVAIESLSAGRLASFQVHPGDPIQKGQVIGKLDQPELKLRVADDRRLLAELLSQDAAKTASEAQQVRLREQQNRLDEKSYEAQRSSLRRSLADAEAVETLLKKRLQIVETLRREGLLAEGSAEFANAHVAVNDNDARIAAYKAQLEQTDGQIHSLETQLSALVQQNLESSTARRNQIAEVKSRIAAAGMQLERSEDVLSDYSGKVVEVYAAEGQMVTSGARLLLLHLEGPDSGLVSLTYFSVKDGKKIRPGMSAQITPDNVERNRFGGIVGKVVSVSPLPITREGATRTVGNRDLVEGLMGPGAWVEVTAHLQGDSSTPSGYRWSSGSGPELNVSTGLTTSARVTVERRAPLTYVFPSLRDAIGY